MVEEWKAENRVMRYDAMRYDAVRWESFTKAESKFSNLYGRLEGCVAAGDSTAD